MKRFSSVWGVVSAALSALLWVLSIPPFEFAEAAYVAFVPLLLWLYTRPSRKSLAICGLLCGWIAWCAILIWLRHVTYFGTVALSGMLGLIFLFWLAAAAWGLPRLEGRAFVYRALGFAGLAGLWVVLEWVRTWLFWGFPWAPMALSQWERPVVLQAAAWTGAYGISFLLIFFNLAVAQTLRSRFRTKGPSHWSSWFHPDIYMAVGLLVAAVYLFFNALPKVSEDGKRAVDTLFTAGVVQPYIQPELKWDQDSAYRNLQILETQTRFIGTLESDLILWPEAATPWPIMPYPQARERVERLVAELGRPLLMGNIAWDREADLWYNGAFLVNPEGGLDKAFYVKRELVPFGEFVPKGFGFIDKIVPLGGDFEPGRDAGLIEVAAGDRSIRIGPLVCYEDVFPRLARESVRAGAEVLYVATNNAWFGEEGGAAQHAAHSVLRAVENRRPVMRCGNGGWSGWIDAFGTIREVLTDARGSVYFRGGGTYSVYQYEDWTRRQSFYTRKGDWFVQLSAGFVLIFVFVSRRREERP